MQTMYAPQNNSLKTVLTAPVNDSATSITVEDASLLPAAPNVLCIGGSDDTELVRLVSAAGNILTVERGFNSTTPKQWDVDSAIYRGITAQDVTALQSNVSEADATARSHASRHATGGADAITPASIGAMSADATPTPASHASSHATGGADAITPASIGASTVTSFPATLTTAWTGGEAPYTQEVTVNGLLATDTPIVDMVASDVFETVEAEAAAWASVYRIVAGENKLTVYASAATETAINLQIKVVR